MKKTMAVKLISLTDDYMPSDFKTAVSMLKRPYITIKQSEYEKIVELTKERGDIVVYKNRRMTFGNADGGFALMPLAAQ